MDQQAWDRINTLEKDIRKAHTNDVCLYPGCREKPIGSHLIAEQTLKIIAQESHVLTWLPTTSYTLLKNVEAGKPLETWDEEPVLVGISAKHKVTSPLFCIYHDQHIFEPLERHAFSNTYEQVALLTYRTVCDTVLDIFAREELLNIYIRET